MKALHNRYFILGAVIVGLLFLFMAVGFFYTPYAPDKLNASAIYAAPSLAHPFGTDNLGRDILSRTMVAARSAFAIGFFTVLVSLAVGVSVGAAAGFWGGLADMILMRLMDTLKSIPGLLFALMIAAVFGKSFWNTVLAISIIMVPSFAHRAQQRAPDSRTRLYPQSACGRAAAAARPVSACAAKRRFSGHHHGVAVFFGGGAHRVVVELPWSRCPAARGELGADAQSGAKCADERAVAFHLSGRPHHAPGAWLQPAGRRAA